VTGFVVESPALNQDGSRAGTFRVYVATEERAKEIASAAPDRTWRSIPFDEMPEKARANLERFEGGI
jgi:hypothetical protein